ncbi:MAG: TrkH family potassium uptake protein [Oscillospiraceae bacterium]|nr:TrkH family potassium uptake protein [Oscillospiraceae bacterium]
MNYRIVWNTLGKVLLAEALLLLLPMTAALVYRESALPFLIPDLLLLPAGAALSTVRPRSSDLFAREGFVCVGLSWILMSLFGALPFVLSGDIPRFVDALFETVSGFTTTGASILENPELLSRGCMFWRLFTHWIGGMGVLVFIAAVLPVSGNSYLYIMRAEVPGPTVSKLVPRVRKTARILYLIYLGLTVLECIFLLLGGMSFYDALLHSFATAGTGGFSTKAASIGAYQSVYIEMVIAVFMLLFGCNFNLFYLILIGQVSTALRSEELHIYLGIIAGTVLVISVNIMKLCGGFANGLRYAFFQVMTILSTTGFSTCDFDRWPELSRWILVLLMFIGGCAGSTGGGMKVSRIIILLKSCHAELKRLILPSRVKRVWFEGKAVSDQVVQGVHVFSLLYLLITAAGVLVLTLDGKDLPTNLTASIACISNVGPGLAAVGPSCNYSFFSAFSKLILSLEMLLGRLEIFPMLFLFSPGVWRRR